MPTELFIGTFFASILGAAGVFIDQIIKKRSEERQRIKKALERNAAPEETKETPVPEETLSEKDEKFIEEEIEQEKTMFELRVEEAVEEEKRSTRERELGYLTFEDDKKSVRLMEEAILHEKERSGVSDESSHDESPAGESFVIAETIIERDVSPGEEESELTEQVEAFVFSKEREEEESDPKNEEKPEKEAGSQEAHKKKSKSEKPSAHSNEIHELLKKAEVHLARVELEEAEKHFIKILAFDEMNIPALQKLAFLYLQTESYRKAEGLYRQLVELTPKNPAVYTNLGLSLFKDKKFDECIDAYQKAIELDPEHGARYANLGQVYFVIKDLDTAIHCFQEAIKRDPRNISFLYLLADTSLEAKHFAEAKKWYMKVLDLSPYDEAAKEEVRRLQALGF